MKSRNRCSAHTRMPATKNGKITKRYQKRGYKRSRSYPKMAADASLLPRVRSLNGWGIGFPQKLRVKLKYGEAWTIPSIIAGATWHNVFRGNSIYDPDKTGTGHQPRYHDQLAALYGFYHVEACAIKLTVHNATDQGALMAFIIPDASTTSAAIPSTPRDVIELPGSQWRHVSAEQAGPTPTVITMYKTSKQMQDDTRESKTPMSNNPSDSWEFVVGAHNAGVVNAGLWATVELTYTVVFSELVEPSDS